MTPSIKVSMICAFALFLVGMTGCNDGSVKQANQGASNMVNSNATSEHVLQLDFENADSNDSHFDLKTEIIECKTSSFAGRATVGVDPDDAQTQVLRVKLPAREIGSQCSGGSAVINLPPSDEYRLSYRFRLGRDFEWTRGGKLPGLASGGSKFTGGKLVPDGSGWSARFMWRPEGLLVAYMYHMDQSGKFGDDVEMGIGRQVRLSREHWHRIEQRIRINTDDQSNGLLEVWLDGKLVFSRHDFRFRKGSGGQIDTLLMSAFYGGSSDRFRPERDQEIWFDDFKVSKPAADSDLIQFSDLKAASARSRPVL